MRLDRVAQGGAGAVGLDHADLVGRQPGVLERLTDHALLGRAVGGGEAVARAVLVDRRAAHDRQHGVTVALRVGQALDEQHARALGPAGAVRTGRERLAAPVGGQAALAAEVDERFGRRHDGRATGECHRALALAQRLHREVQGDQRGGAGRVDGDGGAFQAERVGDATGGDTACGAGAEVALDPVRELADPGGVVVVHHTGEHARAAALEQGRVDPGALDRLPGDLQQQPLLRVHRDGLARRDAEELRVEQARVVQEAALAGVRGARVVGVRVVEVLHVPATTGREAGDRVAAVDDQPPQVVRRLDAARVAAGHADDRDRVVGHLRRRRSGGGGHRGGADDAGAQVRGQRGRGRVVEDQGGRQAQARGRVERVAQLHGGQRVEAEVLESTTGLDHLGRGVAQDGGHPHPQNLQQLAVQLGLGKAGQSAQELRAAAGAGQRGPADGRADQAAQQHGQGAGGGAGAQRAQVDAHRDQGGVAQADGGVEQGQALDVGEAGHSVARQPLEVGGVQGARHATLGPRAPGERERGQAELGPVGGQRVQEGVRSSVVGLAGAAEDGGVRRVEHEGGEVQPGGQLVQVERGVDLGAQHGVEAVGRERGDDAVVQDTRSVDDSGERTVQRAEQLGERGTVGHVARRQRHGGAQLGQFVGQVGRAGRVGAAPAGEQQVPRAVLRDQVASGDRAQGAGAAGDQDGAVRVQSPGGGVLRCRCLVHGDTGQARQVAGTLAYRQLRFAACQCGSHRFGGDIGRVQVEQHEPVRVLGLRGAHQAPHRRSRRVGQRLTRQRRHRTPRHDDQPRVGEPVLGQPALHQPQGPVGDLPHRVRRQPTGGRTRSEHHVRHDLGRRQLPQVGEALDGDTVERTIQRGPTAVLDSAGRHRQRRPLHPEQRLVVRATDGAQLLGGDLTQRQGTHRHHRSAGAVGEVERDLASAQRGDPHPQGGRTCGVQGDAAPGERQAAPERVVAGVGAQRVQRGVEQRGVQAEPVGVVLRPGGQGDLGEDLRAAQPGGPQALEGGTVAEAGLGQVGVDLTDVDRAGVGGRPGGEVEPGRSGACGEHTGGVAAPRLVGRGALDPGVQAERAAAVLVGAAHHDLQLHAAVLGQQQRCLERQFLDQVAADLVAGPDRQIDEGGAGQQHGALHGVVGQPGVGVQGEPPGEQETVDVGEGHRRAQQRVVGGVEADRGDVAERAAALQPVALTLEGVGRQVHPTGALAREDAVPVEGVAADVCFGQGGGEGADLGTAGAQHRQERDGLGDAGLAHGRQHAVGAELHDGADALALQHAHRVREAHGLAHVPHPVLRGADLLGGRQLTGEGGDDRDGRRGVAHHLRAAPELGEHAVHVRGVEGVADRQPLGLAALGLPVGCGGEDGVLVTRDHHGVGPVDGRDGDPALAVGEVGQHLGLGGLQRHHGTAARQFLHEPAAGGDQQRGVGQGEDPGDVGGGQLADRVPGQEVRAQAPGLGEAEERHLDGEQRGLGVGSPVQQPGLGRALGREQHLAQRALQLEVEVTAGLVEGAGEDREGLVQLPAHGQALAALAGEDERGAAGVRRALDQAGPTGALGQRAQRLLELRTAGGDQRRPVLEARAGGGQRVAEVGRALPGVRHQVGVQPLGLLAQGLGGLGREHPRQRRGHDGDRLGDVSLLGGPRGLLDDGVGVGAAHAEGRDARAAGVAALGPGHRLGEQLDGARAPVDVRAGRVDVQGARQHAVLHRHDHLDDAADAGGSLGVADVGLQRAEPQRPVLGAVLAVGGEQGLGLDRVAEGGAGAVRLDGVDLTGRQTGVGQGLADHALLGRAVGGGEAVAGAVLVDRRAAHDRQHGVTVALRVGQALDEQHARALAPGGAVGGVGERLAAAVGGEAALAAEGDERAGVGHHGDAAGQCHAALAAAQRLHGQVQRDQRGGAGGVDGDRRALEAEGVGEPARGDAACGAGDQVALHALGRLVQARSVVLGLGADEDAGAGLAQGAGIDAGALERLPGGLQQQPLLGVHRQRLARRDAEEARVEGVGVVQEAAGLRVAGARVVRVRIVEPAEVPSATGREGGDRVDAVGDELPQLLGAVRVAGEPAGHGDDRDGLVVGGAERLGEVAHGGQAQDLGPQVAGEGGGGGVVEDQGDRQAQPGRGLQPAVQVDGGQRVEAELQERAVGLDGGGRTAAQGFGGVLQHEVQQQALLVGLGVAGQPPPQR